MVIPPYKLPAVTQLGAAVVRLCSDEVLTAAEWERLVQLVVNAKNEADALNASMHRRAAYERSLLTPEQLRDFDEQNELLAADKHEPITVAEYLCCRLRDALGIEDTPW